MPFLPFKDVGSAKYIGCLCHTPPQPDKSHFARGVFRQLCKPAHNLCWINSAVARSMYTVYVTAYIFNTQQFWKSHFTECGGVVPNSAFALVLLTLKQFHTQNLKWFFCSSRLRVSVCNKDETGIRVRMAIKLTSGVTVISRVRVS